MWWAASKELTAYLGTKGIGLVGASGAWEWRDVESAEAGVAQIAEIARSGYPGRSLRVRLWLSGALARPFIVEPVPGLRGWDEVLRLAEGMAPDATGLAGPCTVWMDKGLLGQRLLGVAIDRSTLDQIEAKTRRAPVIQWTSIRPWWAFSIDQALAAQPTVSTLLVEEPDALTLLSGQAQVFSLATTCWPMPEPAQLDGWVRRALLGGAAAAGEAFHASLERDAGPVPPERDPAPTLYLRGWS